MQYIVMNNAESILWICHLTFHCEFKDVLLHAHPIYIGIMHAPLLKYAGRPYCSFSLFQVLDIQYTQGIYKGNRHKRINPFGLSIEIYY